MDDTDQEIKVKAFKIILVGTQSVGKSSILSQLINSSFPTNYQATVGIDYHTHAVKVGNASYTLQIWDTAGQEKFRSLTTTYYKNSNACFCIYDLQDQQSLEKADYYLDKALEENIPRECLFLVGNKKDLGQKCKDEGQQKSKKYDILHFQVSAKEGTGIEEVFNRIGQKLVAKFGNQPQQKQNIELLPNIQISEARKNCKC